MQPTYVKTKLKNVITINEIVTIHYYEFDNSFSFKGEKHNFWEMVYVDKGKLEISGGGITRILKQGEIIFHEPNEFHSVKAYDSAPNFFVITFVCSSEIMKNLSKYTTVLNKNLKPFISSILNEAEKTYVIPKNDIHIKKLQFKENAEIGAEQLIKTYLEQFLIMLIRLIITKRETEIFPSKQQMENHTAKCVKDYISAHITENIKIADLCKQIGFGKTYLSSLFHKQYGTTLINYATSVKIEKAKVLIRENNMNFSEISDFLSFDNPQYFSRVFKKITGLTPTEFKNSLSAN